MTMKVLIIDPVGGISGDMLLAALIHLGCPQAYLEEVYGHLDLGRYSMQVTGRDISGVSCMHLHFDIPESDHARTYAVIRDGILPRLPERIRDTAGRVFEALARAEALIHGVPLDEVHFHEVGAVDSILDIVGIAAALDRLGVDAIHTRPVPLGSGQVDSRHGRLPVPAPATVNLLEGFPVRFAGPPSELATPTGAAVISALARKEEPPDALLIRATGYGCGTKRFEGWPNLCRLMLCEASAHEDADRVYRVEADIDDMMPEDVVDAVDRILEAGAKDAGITPRIMKRGRPGFTVSALCDPDDLRDVLSAFLMHTSTIGVRYQVVDRLVLPRRLYKVATPWGEVGVKEVRLPDGTPRTKAEYADLHEISKRTGLSVAAIRAEVDRVMKTPPGVDARGEGGP